MCNCVPDKNNRHPLVITAQIFSIVAFALSFGWIWTFLVGLCVMILHQLLWCIPVPQSVFWLIAAMSVAVAGLNFFAGAEMMRIRTPDFCWPIFTIELMCNDMRAVVGSFHFVSGSLWLLSAILYAVFVARKGNDNGNSGDDDEAAAVPVAVPTSEGKISDV